MTLTLLVAFPALARAAMSAEKVAVVEEMHQSILSTQAPDEPEQPVIPGVEMLSETTLTREELERILEDDLPAENKLISEMVKRDHPNQFFHPRDEIDGMTPPELGGHGKPYSITTTRLRTEDHHPFSDTLPSGTGVVRDNMGDVVPPELLSQFMQEDDAVLKAILQEPQVSVTSEFFVNREGEKETKTYPAPPLVPEGL